MYLHEFVIQQIFFIYYNVGSHQTCF